MLEVLFIGLSLGSILLLVALGLAITYGAMGVINMAHGEMVMIGAYVTVLSGIWLGANIFAAIPLAFIVTALIGWGSSASSCVACTAGCWTPCWPPGASRS